MVQTSSDRRARVDRAFLTRSDSALPYVGRLDGSASAAPHFELCEDCRLNQDAGKPVTCLERAQFLMSRHGHSVERAREAVMAENRNCNMTRYPVDISWARDDSSFDSMFSKLQIPDREYDAPIHSAPSENINGMGDALSIYFYESLPWDMGIGLERSIAGRYASENNTEENFKTDVAIINLFRNYPGRTLDPSEADLYVVPFPHASFCLSNSSEAWFVECGHVPRGLIKSGVWGNLPYYKGKEKRHLFINGQERFHAHKLLRNVPLQLTIGPRDRSVASHQIVVPYLNDQASFQPSILKSRGEEWWVDRPRAYSLTYFYQSQNKHMKGHSPRRYRMYFVEEVQRSWKDTPRLGGLPYVIQNMRGLKFSSIGSSRNFFTKMYGESVFCLVLPGDSPSQKRFFDAMVMGCIPVVLSFGSGNTTSWYLPESYVVEDTFPWSRGSGSTHPEHEIDYRSFVVEVSGGVGDVKPVLEALLRNSSDIRRRQRLIMEHAPSFSYGMVGESYSESDAFSRILDSLRYYLSNVVGKTEA